MDKKQKPFYQVNVRLSAEEYEKLQSAAEREGGVRAVISKGISIVHAHKGQDFETAYNISRYWANKAHDLLSTAVVAQVPIGPEPEPFAATPRPPALRVVPDRPGHEIEAEQAVKQKAKQDAIEAQIAREEELANPDRELARQFLTRPGEFRGFEIMVAEGSYRWYDFEIFREVNGYEYTEEYQAQYYSNDDDDDDADEDDLPDGPQAAVALKPDAYAEWDDEI